MRKFPQYPVLVAATLCFCVPCYAEEKRFIRGSDDETAQARQKWSRQSQGADVWVISQSTDNRQPYAVCINKDGFKFVSNDIGIIAAAPDWHLLIFNRKGKVYCKIRCEEFSGFESVEKFAVDELKLINADHGSDQVQKLAGQKVVEQSGRPKFTTEKIKQSGIDPAELTVYTAAELPLQSAPKLIIERIYAIKGLNGIPLKIVLKDKKGGTVDCLTTNWCLKRQASPDFFMLPKKYKEVSKPSEVEHPVLKPLKEGQFRSEKPPGPQRHPKAPQSKPH